MQREETEIFHLSIRVTCLHVVGSRPLGRPLGLVDGGDGRYGPRPLEQSVVTLEHSGEVTEVVKGGGGGELLGRGREGGRDWKK